MLIGLAAFPSIACGRGNTEPTAASAQNEPMATASQGLEKFRSTTEPFEIQYPSEWEKTEGFAGTPMKKVSDHFLGPEIDGMQVSITISPQEIKNWVELDDFLKDRFVSVGAEPPKPLSELNDSNISESLRKFKNIKVGGQTTITLHSSSAYDRPKTVKRQYGLGAFFVTNPKNDKDVKRGWVIALNYPGALELPENKAQLDSLYNDFYAMLQSFKLLQ